MRPKPEGLSANLRSDEALRLSQSNMLSLQDKGYYVTRDGALMSNEGEVRVGTREGITYTLRFGEVLYGRGEAITAGAESSDDESAGPGENRYLFITTEWRGAPEPERPSNLEFQGKAESEWSDEDRANKNDNNIDHSVARSGYSHSG